MEKTRTWHTHEELKELLLYYYKDAIDSGTPANMHHMRIKGLTGGRIEIVRAWDALAEEGKIPPREKRKFKVKHIEPRPRPCREKPIHQLTSRLNALHCTDERER